MKTGLPFLFDSPQGDLAGRPCTSDKVIPSGPRWLMHFAAIAFNFLSFRCII
jgi:hypothetical protein